MKLNEEGRVRRVAGKIRNYYAGGNTARGFYSLFESNLQGLERLFILKGGPGTGKSSLMKSIGQEWADKGFNLEYIHCTSDNHSIDGVIIPKLRVGIVDGTTPHVIEPKAPGVIEEYINLGSGWDSKALASKKEEILHLNELISQSFAEAYANFAEALSFHDKWEEIYIENMDFSKVDQFIDKLNQELFRNLKLNKKSDIRHRFLGGATPNGAVNFIQNLTEDVQKRYFIKGRAGTGKSSMLKKIAAEGEKCGLDIEVYHCGFDPSSLDMIIFRELGVALFDSTAPHEYFPDRAGDEIIDMYEIAVMPGTDEIFAEQIREISEQYKGKMKAGTASLAKAKSYRDSLEKIYIGAMDFNVVDGLKKGIRMEIEELAK